MKNLPPAFERKRFGYRTLALLLWLILAWTDAIAQTPSGWLIHDLDRPQPPVVTPGPQKLPVPPPADARVLFDGTDLNHWRSVEGGPSRWIIRDDYMESVPDSGKSISAAGFGDVQLHVEWASPSKPAGEGQGRGNSGVFLMGEYEVQILDSFKSETYPDGQAAAIYGQYPPLVNACRPPGEWQSFDIFFRRPRFDQRGDLVSPARLTMLHNGILVHRDRELWGPTSWLLNAPYKAHPDRLPLALQDHGNPVRYRNIWLRELPDEDHAAPSKPTTRPYVPLPVKKLDRFVGTYFLEGGKPLAVTCDVERLGFQIEGRERLDLVPASEDKFHLQSTAGHVVFSSGEDAASSLELHVGNQIYKAERKEVESAGGDAAAENAE